VVVVVPVVVNSGPDVVVSAVVSEVVVVVPEVVGSGPDVVVLAPGIVVLVPAEVESSAPVSSAFPPPPHPAIATIATSLTRTPIIRGT